MKRMRWVGKIVLALVLCAFGGAKAGATESEIQAREVFVPISSGVRLYTYIWGKDLSQRRPVVLERTPYLHMNSRPNPSFLAAAPYYIDRGYHFVVQAVRGTAGSQGDYHFLSPQEIDDGYDTVEWIARQDFSDGNVAIIGTSFDGFTTMAAAVRNPPSLKVAIVGGYAVNIYTDGFIRNGIVFLSLLDYFRYSQFDEGLPFSPDFNQRAIATLFKVADLRAYDKLLYGRTSSEWQLIADNYPNPESPFWKTRQILTRLPEIRVPTYHIAGMKVDGDMPDVVRGFTYVDRNSPYRDSHHLILGYWDHGNSTPYTADGSNLSAFLKDRIPGLLAYYLKGEPSPYTREPRVQVASNFGAGFVGGASFPLSQMKERTWYFRSLDGRPSFFETKPGEEQTFHYQMLPLELNLAPDPKQTLVFLKKADSDIALWGPVSFDVYASISTPQTDIMAVLSKLDRDGKEQFISDCIAARKVFSKGEVMPVHLDLCPVLNLVKAGETLKVTVTSNFFPTVARNTNRPLDSYYEGFSNADITFYSSKTYPSRMTFSVETR